MFFLSQGGQEKLRYSIAPLTDPGGIFMIDDRGYVRLSRILDREVSSRHEIQVLARDFGQPPRTSTATLTVGLDTIFIFISIFLIFYIL